MTKTLNSRRYGARNNHGVLARCSRLRRRLGFSPEPLGDGAAPGAPSAERTPVALCVVMELLAEGGSVFFHELGSLGGFPGQDLLRAAVAEHALGHRDLERLGLHSPDARDGRE